MNEQHEITLADYDNDELLSRLVLADKDTAYYQELRTEVLKRMSAPKTKSKRR